MTGPLSERINPTGHSSVTACVEDWTALCNATSEGKVWLRCNNWYLKTTKTDAARGRERSAGMWMDSYTEYLQYLLGGKGGTQEELLEFA